jgi:hypothetical protein
LIQKNRLTNDLSTEKMLKDNGDTLGEEDKKKLQEAMKKLKKI